MTSARSRTPSVVISTTFWRSSLPQAMYKVRSRRTVKTTRIPTFVILPPHDSFNLSNLLWDLGPLPEQLHPTPVISILLKSSRRSDNAPSYQIRRGTTNSDLPSASRRHNYPSERSYESTNYLLSETRGLRWSSSDCQAAVLRRCISFTGTPHCLLIST